MKAISLWQPWATAIAVGVKRIETRSWSTNYRGQLLIHAAKRPMDRHAKMFTSLEQAAYRLPLDLPFGCLVACCELVDVRPTESFEGELSGVENQYGDFSDGRFGWVLDNVREIGPIEFRGAQGLFEVPNELLAEAM